MHVTLLLEQVAGTRRRSLLVIAEEISGSVLGLLVANHRAGKLRLLAIRAPAHGTHCLGILEDLAVLTGGRIVTQAAGAQAQDITLTDLGDELQERVSKLLGGVAILQVGAATETELEARKAKAERAVKVLRLALAGGVLPGGGAALLACQPAVRALSVSPDEQIGLEVLT